MNDLISRHAAIDALERKKDKNASGDIGGFYNKIIQNDIDALMQLPSADAEPLRHGQWIRRKTATHHGELYCSICEEESPIQMLWRYCPNCGAEMDGVKYGHWIGIDDFPYKTWECNRCGKIIVIDEPPNYCENCGAKMDLDEVKE